ncbi:MAG: Hsp33 family molecular chaperone HslO [Proteobacteria bacterium]|nr:Hsp33 family molecular chaperone HslO [Pseudomonadota bacterium]
MEQPLALYRRFLWEDNHILVIYTAGLAKLRASQALYNAAYDISEAFFSAEAQRGLEDLIVAATLATESQVLRDAWGWTVRLPFKDWGIFCAVEPDGRVCGRLKPLSPQAADDVVGALAVQRMNEKSPLRQSTLIPRDEQPHLLVEQYFDESEQLPARIAISHDDAVMFLSMPDAHWDAVNALNEDALLDLARTLLSDTTDDVPKQSESPQDTAHAETIDRLRKQFKAVRSGDALSKNGLKFMHEAVFYYDCRCDTAQMEAMLATLPQHDQEALWADTTTLTIECPRCGRKHDIHR